MPDSYEIDLLRIQRSDAPSDVEGDGWPLDDRSAFAYGAAQMVFDRADRLGVTFLTGTTHCPVSGLELYHFGSLRSDGLLAYVTIDQDGEVAAAVR